MKSGARLPKSSTTGEIAILEHEETLGELNNVADSVRIKVALDSGSVANVTRPSNMPQSVTISPNTVGFLVALPFICFF